MGMVTPSARTIYCQWGDYKLFFVLHVADWLPVYLLLSVPARGVGKSFVGGCGYLLWEDNGKISVYVILTIHAQI